jgi:hypothetical protein
MSGVVKFIKTMGFLAVTALLVTACGSSGGDTPAIIDDGAGLSTLSGTAAAGAPIIGTVTIKDSASPANTKFVTIEADGNYSVDVSDLTAPYMVRADGYVGGNEYHLYSAGTAADVGGTINITPLTDLIMANIAGTVAQTYFDSGDFSGLTATELTTQADALKAKLLPVLQAIGVEDSIDFLRASFNTDHTGLDAVLDVVKVTTDTATNVATITNIVTQQQMTSNIETGTYTGELSDTTGMATAVTDIQMISAGFKTFTNLFATGLPSPTTNQTLLGLFDADTFLDEGENLDVFLSEITSDPNMIGISFANIVIQSIDVIDATNGTAVITFDVIQGGVVEEEGPMVFHMIKTAGVWYMQGNQQIANVDIEPSAQYNPGNTSAPITTGLRLNIEDRGGLGITSAVVTGAGLPAGGLTMLSQIDYEWFMIEGNMDGNMYYMNNTQIGEIADTGEVYTIELYIGAALAATYTEKLTKRPYLNGELTAADFPTITAPTTADLQDIIGTSETISGTITWTLPAGLTNDWLEVDIRDDAGNSVRYETTPAPTATSETFTLEPVTSTGERFIITSGWLWLSASDSYGRQLGVGLF